MACIDLLGDPCFVDWSDPLRLVAAMVQCNSVAVCLCCTAPNILSMMDTLWPNIIISSR